MIVDNKNLFGADPNKEPAESHTENYRVNILASSASLQNIAGCGPSRCKFILSGVTIHGVPVAIAAGKYNVTELKPLPTVNDVNGRPVVYQASFSSDCDSTIQDFQIKTCTITNTAIEQ
jgi:hypothetical protein